VNRERVGAASTVAAATPDAVIVTGGTSWEPASAEKTT